jgi:hypothetical protein
MKKNATANANLHYGQGGVIPRSRALIALPKTPRKAGRLRLAAKGASRGVALLASLPIRLVVGAAKAVAMIAGGLLRGAAVLGRGLVRGPAALVVGTARLGAVLGVGIARLVAAPFVLAARLGALAATGVKRGVAAVAIGLFRLVTMPFVLIARLLVGTARLLPIAASATGRGIGTLANGLFRLVTMPFVLAARLLLGTARLLAMALSGIGRAGAALAVGLARLAVAPFVLAARLLVGTARLLAIVASGSARLAGWSAVGAVRGVVALVRGIAWLVATLVRGLVRAVALLAIGLWRLVTGSARLVALAGVGSARGVAFLAGSILVPVVALAGGAAKCVVAAAVAIGRGLFRAVAFSVSLLFRGILALGRGVLATLVAIARGVAATALFTGRIVLRVALVPFLLGRILLVAAARGAGMIGRLALGTGRVAATGFVELGGDAVALSRFCARGIARGGRAVGAAVATKHPAYGAVAPVATLGLLAVAEGTYGTGFPFATIGLLLLASFVPLALLPRPTGAFGVLLAWLLAVVAVWRAERLGASTAVWFDALVYLCALAAVRSTYVAIRAFFRETPVEGRHEQQERAHRRASRAIALVLAVQCVAYAVWAGVEGRPLADAPFFGLLFLLGGGMVLAWVVRCGRCVRTAELSLSLATLAALVGTIATQLAALGAGQVFNAASLSMGVLLLVLASALTVVVHTRLTDLEYAA